MPMMIIQFQLTNTSEEEQQLVPDFCEWLDNIIYSDIDTKINRKKISLRLNYILDKVTWVNWHNDKYNLSTPEIMEAIAMGLSYEQYKDNIWKVQINPNILIPHSDTSIDRLIRFLNYGDAKQRATGIFSNLEREYNHKRLNSLWQMFVVKELGTMTQAKIISR